MCGWGEGRRTATQKSVICHLDSGEVPGPHTQCAITALAPATYESLLASSCLSPTCWLITTSPLQTEATSRTGGTKWAYIPSQTLAWIQIARNVRFIECGADKEEEAALDASVPFLISLEHRLDRRVECAFLGAELGIKAFRWWNAHVPSPAEIATLAEVPFPQTMTPARFGCLQSHLRVWRHARSLGLPYCIVLEDDVDLDVPVTRLLNSIDALETHIDPAWEILWFSLSCAFARDVEVIGHGIGKPRAGKSTVAYAIRLECTPAVEAYLVNRCCLGPKQCEVDVAFEECLRTEFGAHWYLSWPMLGRQKNGISDIICGRFTRNMGHYAASIGKEKQLPRFL